MQKDMLYKKLKDAMFTLFPLASNVFIVSSDDKGIIAFELKLNCPMYDVSCVKFNNVKYLVERVQGGLDKSWLFYREDSINVKKESNIVYLTGEFLRHHTESEVLTYLSENTNLTIQ